MIYFTYFNIDSISKALIKSPMVYGTELDRLFLMKIAVLHQLFDIRVKPRNRGFFYPFMPYWSMFI